HSGRCTVLLITHKFREVMAYADTVSVLRRGRAVQGCRVTDTDPIRLAQAMVGDPGGVVTGDDAGPVAGAAEAGGRAPGRPVPVQPAGGAMPFAVANLQVAGDRGTLAVRGLSLAVAAGEILGIA